MHLSAYQFRNPDSSPWPKLLPSVLRTSRLACSSVPRDLRLEQAAVLERHFELVADDAQHVDASPAPESGTVEAGAPVRRRLDASLIERPVTLAKFFRHPAADGPAAECVPKRCDDVHSAPPEENGRLSPPGLNWMRSRDAASPLLRISWRQICWEVSRRK